MSRIYGALRLLHWLCRCGRLRGLCHRKIRRAGGGSIALKTYDSSSCATLCQARDHAVVAARFEGHWRLLDNRHLVMLEDVQIRRYHPNSLSMNTSQALRRTPDR